MADPLKQLAPPIAPTAPVGLADTSTLAAGGVQMAVPGWLVALIVLLLVALVALAIWWWRRGAGLRALHRAVQVNTTGVPADTAQALAAWAHRYAVGAPAAWWQALDGLRFSRPPVDAASIARQSNAVAQLAAQARAWPVHKATRTATNRATQRGARP